MDREKLDELRELVEFLKASNIAEFDVERPDVKLRIKFAGVNRAASAEEMQTVGAVHPAQIAAHTPAAVTTAQPVAETASLPAEEVLYEVKSPIVGTFYESPAPGAAPFVKVGDQVEAGQVLCIIEAMKLMNEIESDVSGEIVRRIVTAGQPVEYGQALFAVRPR